MAHARYNVTRITKILIISAIFLLAVILCFPLYFSSSYFVQAINSRLSDHTGRDVTIEGHMEVHVWSRTPRFILSDIKIGNAKWSENPLMFEAKRLEFTLRPWELLRGRLVVPELIIDQPKLHLERNAEGQTNWHFSDNPESMALRAPAPESRSEIPVIGNLQISDGELVYQDKIKHIDIPLKISTITGEEGKGGRVQFTGQGTYQQAAFILEMTGDSLLQLRESDNPYAFSLKTIIGKTSAEAEGTVQDPIKLEAVDVKLTLKGANAAELFPLTGIALPPSPPYRVSGHLMGEKDTWDFQDFTGKLGDSDVRGHVIWHPEQSPPYFEGNMISENLDMADLQGFVGANRKPTDEERVIPDTPLDISRMLAMNADINFKGKRVKAPDILTDFFMAVHLKDGVLKLQPISFGIGQGKINADVMVEGRKEPPAVTMDVNFERLSLMDLFAPLAERYGKDNVNAGLIGGKAKLQGYGKSLQEIAGSADGTIGIGMEGGSLSRLLLELIGLDLFRATGLILSGQDEPVPIRCVVGDFAVKDGIMQPHEFLIDTEITAIRGEGQASLQDETMNMRLRVYPKKPTLVSARSPINVTGTFKHPKVGMDTAALVARGGVAAALGTLLTPAAALLAFIGPGLGKESHCAAFIEELDRHTGATIPVTKE